MISRSRWTDNNLTTNWVWRLLWVYLVIRSPVLIQPCVTLCKNLNVGWSNNNRGSLYIITYFKTMVIKLFHDIATTSKNLSNRYCIVYFDSTGDFLHVLTELLGGTESWYRFRKWTSFFTTQTVLFPPPCCPLTPSTSSSRRKKKIWILTKTFWRKTNLFC